MKKENNYWIDENNNKWNCDQYTEEQSLKFSKSLVDCKNCVNCRYCNYCRYCSDCNYCIDCSYCSDCSDCSYCIDCSDFKTNPQIYTSPKIGSRDSQTIFYYYDKKIYVVCGCWKSELLEFEKRVNYIYESGEHRKNYLSEIEKVKILFNAK